MRERTFQGGGKLLQGGARAPRTVTSVFVVANTDVVVELWKLGVDITCRVFQVEAPLYHAVRDREPSARTLSDAVVSGELHSLSEANRNGYAVRKLWRTARRSGIEVGWVQTARLMRSLGVEGVKRSRRGETIKLEPTATRQSDLVEHDFAATSPNQL